MFLSREIDIKLCQIYTKIQFNQYSPYYVTRTSANDSAVSRDNNQFLEHQNIRQMPYMYRLTPEIFRFHPIPPFIFLYSPFKTKFSTFDKAYNLKKRYEIENYNSSWLTLCTLTCLLLPSDLLSEFLLSFDLILPHFCPVIYCLMNYCPVIYLSLIHI